jgi:hypothetical protein
MQSKKTSDKDLATFRTIVDFVVNLHEFFGSESKNQSVRPLNLYHRLIHKLSFQDEDLILKHIDTFKTFCVKNRKSIRDRDVNLTDNIIRFSERIYIDMKYIFKRADSDTTKVIWEYLLTISAYVDPENKTKELLQSLKNNKEGNFIADMIETMGSHMTEEMGDNPNPLSMLSSMMNSDLVSTMMGKMNSGLNDGDLDLGKLLGSMSGIVENVKTEIEKSDDPMMKSLLSLIQIPEIPTTPTPSSLPTIEDNPSKGPRIEECD